jgi:PAS domain S-box-containing protein
MRVLTVSEVASDAAQATAMVRAGCPAATEIVEHIATGETEPVPAGPYDVVVIAGVLGEATRSALQRSGLLDSGLVLLVNDLSSSAARFAHELGTRVCLVAHGATVLGNCIAHEVRRQADRTEREARLHRELNQFVRSSERVRALLNVSVSDVIFSLDVEGDHFRFREINPAFTKATGLELDQVLGKRVEDIIPEPSRSLVLWKYREAIAQRRTVEWDEVTDYPSGKRFGHVSVTPVVDGDGVCTSLIGTVRDVTEERQRADAIRRYANIVSAVQIGLTVWDVDLERDVFTLKAANPAAERITRLPLQAQLGKTLAELMPKAVAAPAVELLREVARTGRTLERPELSSIPLWVLSVKVFPLEGGTVGLAFEDVSEQARSRSLLDAEKRILERVASGAPLETSMTELVLEMERQAAPAIASVLLLSSDGTRVKHCAAPHLPDAYNRAIDGAPIGPKAGSCGTAAALKRPVIVTDIEVDPHWDDYRDLARSFGLRACWSTPIVTHEGRVLGTFALYYKTPRAPVARDLELIARATHVASIAIQRHEIEDQLRRLSASIESAREDERTGIARELHDQLGQSLTALKLDLAWLQRRLKETSSAAEMGDRVKESMQLADELIAQMRRISSELRPALLDDGGLVSALRWQAEEFTRRARIACTVQSTVTDGHLGRDVTTAVFRVLQEALTNVTRHAGATHVVVRLSERDGHLDLEVEDDGKGFDPQDLSHPRALGVVGMRERARRLGGTLGFTAAAPHGAVVHLSLPLSKGASA